MNTMNNERKMNIVLMAKDNRDFKDFCLNCDLFDLMIDYD